MKSVYRKSRKAASKGRKKDKSVVVVGLGYVGLPLALLAAKRGYDVAGLDIDVKKIKLLERRKAPFLDEGVAKELLSTSARFSYDPIVMAKADIVIVCVPTPVYEDNLPNLEPLATAAKNIGAHMRKGTLVIIESTINPGVSEDVVLPILEKESGFDRDEFHLSHCPERVNPGDKVWSLETIPRVVGSLDDEGLLRTARFYESILKASVKPMGSLKEAEAVKVVENSFRDVNIAFVNELAMSFDRLGIDVVNVIEGASTKPFSYMPHFPGCGVGGHCIPVDPYYLISYGRKNGFDHHILSAARTINNRMPIFAVDLVDRLLQKNGEKLSGSRVAVLGLAYKPNVDDTRESPAEKILAELISRKAVPISFDPYAREQSDAETLDEALGGAKAVIVATAHKEFLALDPKDLKKRGVKVVVDGRNCLDKETFLAAGILYSGIGR